MMTDDLQVRVTRPMGWNCKRKMLVMRPCVIFYTLRCSYIMSNHVSCLGHLSLAVSFYDGMLKFFTSSHKEVGSSFVSSLPVFGQGFIQNENVASRDLRKVSFECAVGCFATSQLDRATHFPIPQLDRATHFPIPQLERATSFFNVSIQEPLDANTEVSFSAWKPGFDQGL